jgi:sulfide dehydrogenase cytochrome subunit
LEAFKLKTLKISNNVIFATVLLMLCGSASADISGQLMMCGGCHGEDGRGGDSNIPVIGGLPAVVQEDALFAYMDGDRQCASIPMMCKAASTLTEDQIVELAEHFSAMPYAPAGEEFDAALAGAGKTIHEKSCAICHNPDDPESPILHGQRMDYLRYALEQYAAGGRNQMPAMEKSISVLSSGDIEALLNYYASYQQ